MLCYQLPNSYENLKHWITDSGLIISNPDDENYGGVYSYFDEDKKNIVFFIPKSLDMLLVV